MCIRDSPQSDSTPPESGDSEPLHLSTNTSTPPEAHNHPPAPSSEPPLLLTEEQKDAENTVDESSRFSLPTLGFLLSAAPPLSSIPIGERTVAHEMHTLRTMYLTMRRELSSFVMN
eukprot:TRINITY_DN51050_c0_g1_i1.p1 TRINITY_DN51050_c0_g1~~TRINITY_DN51050_c0_g1_i1.p1  ORF type:complete len:116 (-),score=14.76 TRINITY_DN51050_c0_g1_i1:188-535(-)